MVGSIELPIAEQNADTTLRQAAQDVEHEHGLQHAPIAVDDGRVPQQDGKSVDIDHHLVSGRGQLNVTQRNRRVTLTLCR